jgi:hypothetical protein
VVVFEILRFEEVFDKVTLKVDEKRCFSKIVKVVWGGHNNTLCNITQWITDTL